MQLSSAQKLTLLVQMNRVRAEDELRANPWGKGLSTDEFFDLVQAATGSEEEARRRAKLRRSVMIREGLEPT